MLLLKFLHHLLASPDKGELTCYELISYHFVIIIGLQKYGFSLKWQTIFVYFSSYPFYCEQLTNIRYYSFH